ncbi:hypothetical protein OROGR_026438 [Orobanche gracilis]
MRDGEPRHNDDSRRRRGLGPYSTSIKKAEKEKEIKEMAKKINDLCEMGAIFLWVYVYNIVRISVEASFIDVNDSSICKYTSERTAVKPESITEVFRIHDISRKLNLKRLFAPSTNGADNVFVNVVASIHYRAQSEKANDAFYRLTNTRSQIQAYISDDTQSTMLYSFVILPYLL